MTSHRRVRLARLVDIAVLNVVDKLSYAFDAHFSSLFDDAGQDVGAFRDRLRQPMDFDAIWAETDAFIAPCKTRKIAETAMRVMTMSASDAWGRSYAPTESPIEYMKSLLTEISRKVYTVVPYAGNGDAVTLIQHTIRTHLRTFCEPSLTVGLENLDEDPDDAPDVGPTVLSGGGGGGGQTCLDNPDDPRCLEGKKSKKGSKPEKTKDKDKDAEAEENDDSDEGETDDDSDEGETDDDDDDDDDDDTDDSDEDTDEDNEDDDDGGGGGVA